MFKRSIFRIVATLVALLAGVAVSARASLAVNVPDPIGPVSRGGSAPHLGALATPSTSVVVLGMDWQLALAVAVFAIAAALFITTALQRRHLAHL